MEKLTNLDLLQVLEEKEKIVSKKKFENFVRYTYPDYQLKWFHKIVCEWLDKLSNREIKKLMIFLPPQHGKTELSSRRFPAYLLGKNPSEKIILGSYNSTKAGEFVTDCKKVMNSNEYQSLYPETQIRGKDTGIYFEVNGGDGFVKGAGMDSGVTGTTASCYIIDDPFKGRNEANSPTMRDRHWGSLTDDFKTRLDNNSIELMLFTRWHEDDIAGRIIDPENEHYDEEEASEWTVLVFQALKEIEKPHPLAEPYIDPRKIDEALWEEKHTYKKFITRRRIAPTSHASLDQQRPSAKAGNKIKLEWFEYIDYKMLPFNPQVETTRYYIDGAYTEKTKNDETGLLSGVYFRGKLYIYNCHGVRKELHELLTYFQGYESLHTGGQKSIVNIELKASGYPLKSMLSKPDYGNHNCVGVPDSAVRLGKYNRVENAEPFLAGGKVVLVKGAWNKRFVTQCATFPNATHDDMVDCLTYFIDEHFIRNPEKKKPPQSKASLGLK